MPISGNGANTSAAALSAGASSAKETSSHRAQRRERETNTGAVRVSSARASVVLRVELAF